MKIRTIVILVLILVLGPVCIQFSFSEKDKETTIVLLDEYTNKGIEGSFQTLPGLETKYNSRVTGKGNYVFKIPGATLVTMRISAPGYKTKYTMKWLSVDGVQEIVMERQK